MEHCYIFYYPSGDLLHMEIDSNKDVNEQIRAKGLDPDDCLFMTTTEPKEIEEL